MLAIPLRDDNLQVRTPVVTYGLIAACTLVFLWQSSLPPRLAQQADLAFGMIPAVLFGQATLPPSIAVVPAWATMVTSMFLHGGLLHLVGNMLYLWLFGKAVEDALGSGRYLAFYLISGLAAALAQATSGPASEVPMIGASGAIAGLLGAYLVLYPRAQVQVFIWFLIIVRLIAVPAVLLLGLWFLMQVASGLAPGEPGVAFWAHVGGFIAGMILVPFFRRRSVRLLQPGRSQSFTVTRPGDGRFGRGSVPRVGRPRGKWG